ncbi:hypothetical protein C5F64_16405 [Photobacterium damselae subsp. damselae]|nr:hypothetical protein C5F64_16405 [Photobacterium damselae subsp. damselae]PSB82368.1 hypothetical protein C5F62_10480 [Photobacterium damselae subsp. damselae]PSB88021.1 hypothetical protein C5F63_08845 [Photobacterium damselae subsp. damselae]PSW77193.1 hypothetical protein CTN07_22070 [Photobacterium damselae]
MNKKKWDLIDERFFKSIERAYDHKGYISLVSIVQSQFNFPQSYTFNVKEVDSITFSKKNKTS